MKKLITISLCAALVLGLSACGASSSSSSTPIAVVPPAPVSSESSSTEQQSKPPVPADAAMYRGTVTLVDAAAKSANGDTITEITLVQAEGTDFGAPTAKFAFTANTRADFTPEQGQYLEVYYGAAPGKPQDFTVTTDVITAIKYHSEEMVNYNGYVVSITAHPDKPNQGWIMMSPTPPTAGTDDTAAATDEKPVDGTGSSADASPAVAAPSANEIRFNYDKEETKFYLNLDEIKVGDHLNIFQSGAMTMSIPPQSFAIELRSFADTAAK